MSVFKLATVFFNLLICWVTYNFKIKLMVKTSTGQRNSEWGQERDFQGKEKAEYGK